MLEDDTVIKKYKIVGISVGDYNMTSVAYDADTTIIRGLSEIFVCAIYPEDRRAHTKSDKV